MSEFKKSYKSPVTLYEINKEIINDFKKREDDLIMLEINKQMGVYVDKEELIKAMNYERNQYDKGFNDALEQVEPKLKVLREIEEMMREQILISDNRPVKNTTKKTCYEVLGNIQKLLGTNKPFWRFMKDE